MSLSSNSNVPFSFGQVFKRGDIPSGRSVSGVLPDDESQTLQVDVKTTYEDGSLKFAVLSGAISQVDAQDTQVMDLRLIDEPVQTTPVSLNDLLATNFDAQVHISTDADDYSVSARDLLQTQTPNTWLEGGEVTEWQVQGPLLNSSEQEHDKLHVRFNVRAYAGMNSVRVSVVLENTWTWQESPSNQTYSLNVTVGGSNVLNESNLTHYHHSRWRRVFWWGEAPELAVTHDTAYLVDTAAVPNYDLQYGISESKLNQIISNWTEDQAKLMGIGSAESYMPQTGGRTDIGLLPGWDASYVVSGDERAQRISLANGEQAGTWAIHYRDKSTDLPVSLETYPRMHLWGGTYDGCHRDSIRPSGCDDFPDCDDCRTPNTYDTAHQPSFAYVPYLISGDYYFLEELLFWANFDLFVRNPGYRNGGDALFKHDQVRGAAWTLRTIAQTSFIIPDDHPMKGYFSSRLDINRQWYEDAYLDDVIDYGLYNGMGWIGQLPKPNNLQFAGWMDDFFTSAVAMTVNMGFTNWQRVLEYKAQYPVGRMYGTDYCWIFAPTYNTWLRPATDQDWYSEWGDIYDATIENQNLSSMAGLPCGGQEMADALTDLTEVLYVPGQIYKGSINATGNYVANLQPALAAAVESGIPGAQEAWNIFMNRAFPADYTDAPIFNIVPRD